MPFQKSSAEEFDQRIAAKASREFLRHYERFEPSVYEGWSGEPDYMMHSGALNLTGNLVAPALCTLVDGDLTVDGLLDLVNDETRGFDEGGLFVVLGAVRCRNFIGHYGKCVFVDGNIVVRDVMITAHEDSSVVSVGDLEARFLHAGDTWPLIVGAGNIDYGDASCLDIDSNDIAGAPRHGKKASAFVLGLKHIDELFDTDLAEQVRAGKAFFE